MNGFNTEQKVNESEYLKDKYMLTIKETAFYFNITMNMYTYISFDDAEEELKRMEEFRKAQSEIEKKNDAKAVSRKMFKVV